MGILSALRKNLKLSGIMKRISPPNKTFDPERLLSEMLSDTKSDRQLAEDELFDLITNDPDLSAIMLRHGATETDVRHAYSHLVRNGAGQWVRGAYVAAAAVATNPSLDHILNEVSQNGRKEAEGEQVLSWNDFWLQTAGQMIQFFSR